MEELLGTPACRVKGGDMVELKVAMEYTATEIASVVLCRQYTDTKRW